jgi:DNA-binding HxlR family transcriptional regulator
MPYTRRALAPDAFLKTCPSRQVLARVGEKWALMSVVALAERPQRFGELMRRLQGISQKMLSQTLRALERDGIVARKAFDEVPLRVEYRLTPLGLQLLPLALALKQWGEQHLRAIEVNHARYDRRRAKRASELT